MPVLLIFDFSLLFYLLSLVQVSKIKADEREDLKVLATGVAAALAARKVTLSNS
jgi:THO complex subunit 2